MSDEVDTPAAEPTSEPAPEQPAAAQVSLRCLGGGAFSEGMLNDAGRLSKLPDHVQKELGRILRACVLQPMTPEVGEQLSRFCLQHEVAEADLGGIIKVCSWLLREASAVDLSDEHFAEDVKAIWAEPGALGEALLAEYGPLKRSLREQLLADALVKHGNVLVDVDWRVDHIATERRAAKLGAVVALVTLAYRDVEQSGRLTLQITPGRLERLAHIFGVLAQKARLAVARPDRPHAAPAESPAEETNDE